ncbi:MAG TPA: cytochrome c [Longimicrobiaceae bacterium]
MKLSAGASPLRQWGGTLVIALAALAFATTRAEAQADGAKVFATVCASCHQANGQGVPGAFPPLAESEWVTGDPARLVKIILHGLTGEIDVGGEVYAGMMPPWGGGLNDQEVAAVATYVRSNFGNEASPVTPEVVAAIRKEFASRKTPWTAQELAAK